jgi:hypothetical protein
MRRAAAAGVCGLWFFLGTGCATIIREAVQRDIDENARAINSSPQAEGDDGESLRICPEGKIQKEDCRVLPCKVTCEDPEGTKP